MEPYILKNGTFIPSSEKIFQYNEPDRFLFSEKVRAVRNRFPFWKETVELLFLKFKILNEPIPEILLAEAKDLKRQMERLLVKNKYYRSAIIEIRFFRNTNQLDYYLSAESINEMTLELNQKGLLVEVFDKIPKAVSELSNLSFGSEAIWKIASAHLSKEMDDYLIINTDGRVIEGIGKSLFLIKGNQLKGVSPLAGASIDVACAAIPSLATNAGLEFSIVDGFTTDEIQNADELFFMDALHGIQWILGFRGKRFYNIKARVLSEKLNEL